MASTQNQNSKQDSGYLEIIMGPMFSGKTSKLLEVYKQCNFCNIPVLVINYAEDTRYHDTMLSTHDKVMIPCIFTNKIADVWESISKSEIILINEGQFFVDLYEEVFKMIEIEGKKVHICGLDGDFLRKKFGNISDLLPLCDEVVKLKAKCNICNDSAIFSHRITQEKQQVVIGSDNYIPLCRKCYNSQNYN
jgi:thymidine kinase